MGRPRQQAGFLFRTKSAWQVKYRVTELRDGAEVRVQRTRKLCDRRVKGVAIRKSLAEELCERAMDRVNAVASSATALDQTVKQFWENEYVPFIEKTRRPSTLAGYRQLWKSYLEPYFISSRLTVCEFSTPDATALLTSLVEEKNLGHQTITHIRNLGSGIFNYAKKRGLIANHYPNPWREAGSLVPPKESKPTQTYSLPEALAISDALHDAGHVREQLIFCIAAFAGLRPGEICGLKWPDVCENGEREFRGAFGFQNHVGWIDIRRAVVVGVEGKTKTKESGSEENPAPIPLIGELRSMFSAWRAACGNPTDGWVLTNRDGEPINLEAVTRNIIAPALKAAGLIWKGLYSGRRSTGTLLTALTGNALAAFYVLRHKDLATTTRFYLKATPEPAIAGMRLLGARLEEHKALAAAGDAQGC